LEQAVSGEKQHFVSLRVTSTAVGYSGGDVKNPTYKGVCTGKKLAEVVEVRMIPR